MVSRRSFMPLMAAPFLGIRAARHAAASLTAYRVDAVIVLFSKAIYSRAAVGEGILLHEELAPSAGLRQIHLAFAGGSRPDRARGLNRFGYFSELVTFAPDAQQEASYFGFMTRSEEKSLAQAAERLKKEQGQVPVAVIRGELLGQRHRSLLASAMLPQGSGWASWCNCLKSIVRGLHSGELSPNETNEQPAAAGTTFLHTLAAIVEEEQGERQGRRQFLYGKTPRAVSWTRAADPGAEEDFRSRGLLGPGHKVVRLQAAITSAAGGRPSRFSLWYDPSSRPVLPLRIELQPRSFLRLRFEAVPGGAEGLESRMQEARDAWQALVSGPAWARA